MTLTKYHRYVRGVVTLVVVVQFTGCLALFGFPTALYTDKDDITLLNVTNFKETIFRKENAWILEFYSSWCGHCVKFAPTWIELARSVKGWKKVIRVAAIDCAAQVNFPVCEKYNVTAFPSIRFLPPYVGEGDGGKPYLSRNRDVDSFEQAMAEFVSTGVENAPGTWPDLHSISYLDMNSLWKDVPLTVSHVALVVEAFDSYLGRQVILDTLSMRKYIRVLRAVKDRAPLVEHFKEISSPFLIIANKRGELKTYKDMDNSRSGYVQYLEDFAKNFTHWKGETEEAIPSEPTTPSHDEHSSVKKPATDSVPNSLTFEIDLDKVYMQDLENSVHYMLWQEVALHKNITGSELKALTTFVSVLDKYFPGRENTKLFLNQLNSWLEKRSSHVTSEALRHQMDEFLKSLSFEFPMKEWLGCRGSFPYLRGYPCGLWTLFHTLTVSAFSQNGKDADFDQMEVLDAIRGYVTYFFSCKTCSEHFANMSAHLSSEVKTREDSVLWLWQAHNQVNARLKGDETEDPVHPKIQFPSEALCSNCRLSGDDTSQWDLMAVLEFLLSHYSAENIVEVESIETKPVSKDGEIQSAVPTEATSFLRPKTETVRRREVRRHSDSAGSSIQLIVQNKNIVVQTSVFTKWGFGTTDISLCILLYVSSIVLLIVCYFYILSRRRSLLNALKRRTLHYFV